MGGYCLGGILSWGLLSGGGYCPGGLLFWGFCSGGCCPGDIVRKDIVRGILSWGILPGGGVHCPGGGDILLPFWRFVLPEHHHLKVCLGERTCIYNGTTGENINYTCMSEANIIRYASRAGQGDSLLAG